ncbi:hypothetical protein WICPIJ_002471 [Wickerhamomyces pijperi]|uniref:Uncharacterized protein n=1 Tax=Wickerhamomyces pijperi TaxID=599730 RepID=A0A9P8QBR6_WICPI|nr:hypothetical protein WICPIJ_002471 [Wickerhamomyces pijperi]
MPSLSQLLHLSGAPSSSSINTDHIEINSSQGSISPTVNSNRTNISSTSINVIAPPPTQDPSQVWKLLNMIPPFSIGKEIDKIDTQLNKLDAKMNKELNLLDSLNRDKLKQANLLLNMGTGTTVSDSDSTTTTQTDHVHARETVLVDSSIRLKTLNQRAGKILNMTRE